MLLAHLTIALRLMRRHVLQTAINILGLALGLAACITILCYVRYERSYDGWLPGSDRIFQVQTVREEAGQPAVRSQNSPFPVHDMLTGTFSDIAASSVLRAGKTVTMRDGEPLFIDVQMVDPDFFKVFRLTFLAGSAATALSNTNSIVITRTEAIRQFGRVDVLGRTMSLGAGDGRRDRAVSGVIEDLPRNSSLRLSLLYRYDPAEFDQWPARLRGWNAMDQQHYVRLRDGADAATVERALAALQKRIMPTSGETAPTSAAKIALHLVPISAVHLGAARAGALAPVGDAGALVTFTTVALLVLGMSIMNYVNLSTARATLRAREVGLRKLFGATRGQLIAQFLGESLLTASVAMLFAMAMTEIIAPRVGHLIGAPLDIHYLGEGGMLVPALLLILLTGIGGGLYPAFVLSRFRPGRALRASWSGVETPASNRLRTALVVLQFAAATGLIACTWVMHAQTRFVGQVDPGYRRDGLIQLESAWRFAGDSTEYRAARQELMRIPGVIGAGRTNLPVAATTRSTLAVHLPGAPTPLDMSAYGIDNDFLATMDAPLLAGRMFDDRFGRDVMPVLADYSQEAEAARNAELGLRGINIIISRGAVRRLGFGTPGAAIGKSLDLVMEGAPSVPATVVGVVADMRMRTARDPAEPLIFMYDPAHTDTVLVRYAHANPQDVMDGIHAVWRRFEPEIPFQGRFVEAIVAELYAADRARGVLFAAFSLVAVLIASLGLYSLASFTTDRRRREIGIRKVLGARVLDIVRLLAWQFSRPVILAGLLAWPVAWWAMRAWLNQFDIRIGLTPLPFLLSALLALAIALATTISRAVRVASTKPIDALRYE